MSSHYSGQCCSVCYETYSVHGESSNQEESCSFVPLTLDCGHSLCHRCWQKVAEFPSTSCPFCFKVVRVGAPKNFALIQLLEEIERSEKTRKRERERGGGGGGEEKKEGFSELCNICHQENGNIICLDCGGQRQCHICSDHLHQLDRLASHRRRLDDSKHLQQSLSSPSISPSPPSSSLKEEKEGEKKEKNSKLSPMAREILRLSDRGDDYRAILQARHHALFDGDSAALLAMLIFDGLGTKISQTESELWSKVANEFGTPFGKGIYLYLQKNFKEAINYLLPFSEDGVSIAQRCVGRCYEDLDRYELAYDCYCKSAAQGNPLGINNMGGLIISGKGTPLDLTRGRQIWEKLIEDRDLAQTEKNFGYYFKNGVKFEKNVEKAAGYLRRAADQGNTVAQNYLAECYLNGTGVRQSDLNAFQYYKAAADGGLIQGYSNLGYCYSAGRGVPIDDAMGFFYYNLAAEKGSAFSQKVLGRKYETGEGVEADLKVALEYYQMAADQGDKKAKEEVLRISGLLLEKETIK